MRFICLIIRAKKKKKTRNEYLPEKLTCCLEISGSEKWAKIGAKFFKKICFCYVMGRRKKNLRKIMQDRVKNNFSWIYMNIYAKNNDLHLKLEWFIQTPCFSYIIKRSINFDRIFLRESRVNWKQKKKTKFRMHFSIYRNFDRRKMYIFQKMMSHFNFNHDITFTIIRRTLHRLIPVKKFF